VASITEADLFEIYTLRDALGGLAAERAAARVTPAEQQVLRQILTEMEEAAAAGNRRRMLDLDFRFHRAIVDMCDHARLAQMYTNLETQTRLFLTMTEMLHHSLDDSVMLHRDLAEAIIAGDPDRAYKLGRRHSERDAKELASALFHSQEG
jgi:DNA-binding GntR family transcriptional regulator